MTSKLTNDDPRYLCLNIADLTTLNEGERFALNLMFPVKDAFIKRIGNRIDDEYAVFTHTTAGVRITKDIAELFQKNYKEKGIRTKIRARLD